MTTLTITDAKKNLGKWLSAAVHGEDVGIISGAAIVALKPVKVRIAHPVEIREIDYDARAAGIRSDQDGAGSGSRSAARRIIKRRSGKALSSESKIQRSKKLKRPLIVLPQVLSALRELPKSEQADTWFALFEFTQALERRIPTRESVSANYGRRFLSVARDFACGW